MKKFFEEFKKFITRGNVVDMAVGVTVGSAFTAIVNGLTNFVLKPLINWIIALLIGADSLAGIVTPLKAVYTAKLDSEGNKLYDAAGNLIEELDLAKSIYIDWGSLINAILNFFIIAFVLFVMGKYTKAQKAELKAAGIKLRDKDAAKAYFAEKEKKEAEAKAKAEAEAAEAARIAYENSTEALLKQIRDLLANK